jgi:hypothetical protein
MLDLVECSTVRRTERKKVLNGVYWLNQRGYSGSWRSALICSLTSLLRNCFCKLAGLPVQGCSSFLGMALRAVLGGCRSSCTRAGELSFSCQARIPWPHDVNGFTARELCS